MLKKIFIIFIFIGALFLINEFNNLSEKSTNFEINYSYSNSLASNEYNYNDPSSEVSAGSAGGGLPALIVLGIFSYIEYLNNESYSTLPIEHPFSNLDDVLSGDIREKLNSSSLSEEEVYLLIYKMTRLHENDLKDEKKKKTLYLGTTNDLYYKVAQNNSGIAFYSPNYDDLIDEYGQEILFLINSIVIEFAIADKWNIILVSNPSIYYNIMEKSIIPPERVYSKELLLINGIHNKYWTKYGPYWKVIL